MPVTPVTGKASSSRASFIVDGYNMLAAKLQALRYKITVATEKTDGMGDSWDEHTPTGSQMAELAQEGAFFDTSAGNSHAALVTSFPADANAAVRVAVLGFHGNVIGQPIVGFEGVYTGEYEVLSTVGALQRANAAHIVTGKAEEGVILHALTTEVADAVTEPTSSVDNATALQRTQVITAIGSGNPSPITTNGPHGLISGDTVIIAGSNSTPSINGERVVTVTGPTTFTIPINVTGVGTTGTFTRGKTSNGGAAYVETTALSLGTFTDALITFRHSADDGTYADLVAMTAQTAARGAERKTVAGVVNRYLASSLDFRGAGAGGSITYLAAFARA